MKNNKKVKILTSGTFDLLHSGHLNILKNAKSLGDYLIVAVSTDELVKTYKEESIVSFIDRCEILKHIDFVDEVIPQTKLFDYEQFENIGADYYVIGNDWEDNTTDLGLNMLRESGKLKFFPYTKRLSTTKIKEKIIKNTKMSKYLELQES